MMTIDTEPTARNSVVRDRDGHRWRRAHKWWRNQDGPGRLPWYALQNQYGPLTTDEDTRALEAHLRARRSRGGDGGDH